MRRACHTGSPRRRPASSSYSPALHLRRMRPLGWMSLRRQLRLRCRVHLRSMRLPNRRVHLRSMRLPSRRVHLRSMRLPNRRDHRSPLRLPRRSHHVRRRSTFRLCCWRLHRRWMYPHRHRAHLRSRLLPNRRAHRYPPFLRPRDSNRCQNPLRLAFQGIQRPCLLLGYSRARHRGSRPQSSARLWREHSLGAWRSSSRNLGQKACSAKVVRQSGEQSIQQPASLSELSHEQSKSAAVMVRLVRATIH